MDLAARLLGASEAALQAVYAVAHEYPVMRREHQRQLAAGQSGPAAASFSAGHAAGRATSVEDAVAYALSDDVRTVEGNWSTEAVARVRPQTAGDFEYR